MALMNIEDSSGVSDDMRHSASHKLGDPDATADISLSKMCKVARHGNKIPSFSKRSQAKAGERLCASRGAKGAISLPCEYPL